MKRLKVYLSLAALVLCAAAHGAPEARAQAGNTVHACYNTTNGQLRRVDSPAECRSGETALDWNVKGEKGDKGDKGDKGEAGPQGERGETGATGATGAQGEKGDKGDKGDTGATGPAGPQGEKGEKGEQGLQGAQGPQGDTGAQGPQGERGPQGEQGLKGDKGDKGDTGAQGPQGEQGPQGLKGDKGDKGERGETGAQGAQGPQGEKGAQGDRGEVGPEGPAGQSVTGIYVPPGADCASGGVMYTSAGGNNHFVCNGAAGEQGAQGPQGPAGPQGPTVATFPIGRAPAGGFEAITFNDNSASFVCGGQYLGQATIDPTWFGAAGIDYRVVVFGERTSGGLGDDLFFDFCAGSNLGDGGGSVLHTNVVFDKPHFVDSGWKTLAGTSPVRINLHARKRSAAAGSYGQAYILVRPRQ